MQILKEEVKNKILLSAEKIFYQKDYREAKLVEIADKAGIPTALIYTYFKNKSSLFDAVVSGIQDGFIKAMEDEEAMEGGTPSQKFKEAGEKYIQGLLKNHVRLVILMDKSSGTKHEGAKELWIKRLQLHIDKGLKRFSKKDYDPMLSHILANNYVEGLLEIARHYKDDMWAKKMLLLMNQCYYKGVESLT